MKNIVVLDSSAVWQREFIRLCVHLTSFLEMDCLAIRHVGSTSVPGLAAKPILDIDIVMKSPDDLDKLRKILEHRGYYYRGDLGINGRFAFGYGSSSFMRHHLYGVEPQSESYLDHLVLREGLKYDPQAIVKYTLTKRAMAERHPQDIDAYIDGKTMVIKEIMESEAGKKARLFNRQIHHKEMLDDGRIRLKTVGAFPGEILFTKAPFEILEISGTDDLQAHLAGFAKEIALGYR
ncbi:MAG: GrpB family protein [Erysipelotrichaceae bacterium]